MNDDAVNKKYVDRRMSETASAVANQSSITSNLDMKTFEIINLSPGTDPKSAVTKDQLDMAIQETHYTRWKKVPRILIHNI